MTVKSLTIGGTVQRTVVLNRSYWQYGVFTRDSFTENPTTAWAYFRKYRSRTWNTTPSWRALLASQGWLPALSYGDSQETFSQSYELREVNCNLPPAISNGVGFGQYFCTMPETLAVAGGNLYSSFNDVITLDAKYKALAKARDMQTNVAEFFGDGRKTVHMIRDIAKRLGGAYRDFRRGRFSKAAKALGINKPTRTAANHWLEYTYGWSPLLSDAHALAEKAAQQIGLGGRPPRFTARGKAFIGKPFLEKNPNAQVDYHQGLIGYTWDGTYRAVARAGLLCEVEYAWSQAFASLGYGLYDPALLAWELTPFSFVFDWFIDVGSWLEQASSLQGVKVLTGFTSLERLALGKAISGTKTYDNWTLIGPPVVSQYMHRHYSRLPWDGGYLRFRTPLLDGLKAGRLVTTASLWKQRCRGDRVPGGYKP